METKKVINYLEYSREDHPGEFNTLASETIPGQALSVKEVLIKFTQGTLNNIVQPVYYDDIEDYDSDDITLNPAFDLTDVENYKNNILNKREMAKIEKSKQKEAKDDEMSKKEKAEGNENMDENEV
ncbi:MAG: hypothetical protein QXI16_04015 [Sulfolobaceae archaeon]